MLKPLLDSRDPAAVKGRAHYLLDLNDALRRSVVSRWARGKPRWSPSDGLVRVVPGTASALASQRLGCRPYSLSALQRFATCPYQFLLATIHRLEPWEEPEPLMRLDPLTRGSLFHRAQAEFYRALDALGRLPVTVETLPQAVATLHDIVDRVAGEYADELAPAIERVWRDEIDEIRRDLGIWVRRLADGADWIPAYFEFSFGLHDEGRDPRSLPDPVLVDGRFILRGSVDLVERHRELPVLRVTDHKTGRNRSNKDLIVGGGTVLQPVLYSVAVEQGLGTRVHAGRLFYCTTAGGFAEHEIADQRLHARAGAPGVDDRRSRGGARHAAGGARRRRVPLVRLPRRVRTARRGARRAQARRAPGGPRGAAGDAMSPVIPPPPSDAEARRAIADDLDATLVVEAAAGTGKTTELVNRVLRVLATGRATMDEIVAVTFTEKAAGELKLRLREALEQARGEADDAETRRRLEGALETLEEAHVNTIHGFCAELLRERPVEAGVDPLFTVLTEPDAARLYARAFAGWLQETLQDPPDGVRRALRRTSAPSFGDSVSDGPIDRLRGAGQTLAEWRSFTHPWTRAPFDRDGAIARVVARLHRVADLSADGAERDNLRIDLDGVRRLSRQIRLEESFDQRDLDAWESRVIDLLRDWKFSHTRKGSGHRFGRHTRTEVLAARDELLAAVQQFKRDADADLAALLQPELAGATERYQALKARAGALDFVDLLGRTRDLLRANADVRRHLQRRFRRIFVDEFQDTDPVQAEILLLLAAADEREADWQRARPSPGKLFIVGDPKQAIYRFRGTDVGTYWLVCHLIAAADGRVLQLTKSYRSVPAIQKFVNAAFEAEMIADERTLQAGYVPLAEKRPPEPGQPALVALPVPAPYGRSSWGPPKVSAKAVEKSLPDAVGAFIAWLVDESGWTVVERQSDGVERRVPVAPRHVAVLFRRFVSFGADLTRGYIDAIEARGLPHLLVGGRAFHDCEEVETVRAALAAIEWPDDELSVFATLKGSFFAIDDEALLEFRHRFGSFHPFRVPVELGGNSGGAFALSGGSIAPLVPIADALRALQGLHRGRNARPVADTIGRLLAITRAHVGFMLRPAGEQVLANVLHVAELARQYEAGGGISFRGFIDELRQAADASDAAEAPIVEEGSDGVRLMTVHKAKGLEFPVVILADLTCRMQSRFRQPLPRRGARPVRAQPQGMGAARSSRSRSG